MKKICKMLIAVLVCCGFAASCDDESSSYVDVTVPYAATISHQGIFSVVSGEEVALLSNPPIVDTIVDRLSRFSKTWKPVASGNTLEEVYQKTDLQMTVAAAAQQAVADALMNQLRGLLEQGDFGSTSFTISGIQFVFERLMEPEKGNPVLLTKDYEDLVYTAPVTFQASVSEE